MKSSLLKKRCKECQPGTPALTNSQIRLLLPDVPGWELAGKEIAKAYQFKDYYHTIAFVNAIAWLANRENHHPDLEVGYNRCRVRFSTHSVGGLSENDFICAAKLDSLIA
jgi:4a-hydroxytetrahydrobiopterin dehydratase